MSAARLPSPSALSNPNLLFGLPSAKFKRSASPLSSRASSPSAHTHGIPAYSSSSSAASLSSRNGSTNSSFSTASLASRYRPTPLPSPAVESLESPLYERNTPSFEYDPASPASEQLAHAVGAFGAPPPLTQAHSYSSFVSNSTDSSFSATQSPVYSTFDHSRASSANPSPLAQVITDQIPSPPADHPSRANRPSSISISASTLATPSVHLSSSIVNPNRPTMSRSQLSYSNHMRSHVASLIDSVSREVAAKRAEANAKRLAEANERERFEAAASSGRKRTSGADFVVRRDSGEVVRNERLEREKKEKMAREEASEMEREREMRAVGGDWRKIGVL